MKFEAVTIKDIARELGLSTSTVSRALRDSYEISNETKKVVLECAERLDYRPNPIALSLKEKRSRSIGVIVCEINNSFFSQAINGIESIAYSKGYNVIISQSHESYIREVSDLNYLASRSIDGLLISVSAETNSMEHLQKLHTRGLPIVFFDRINEELNTHKVIIDNFKAAYKATEHLVQQGFRQIACVVNSAHLSIAQDRIEGYKKALADNGLQVNPEHLHCCSPAADLHLEVEKGVNKFLELQQKPDAIVGLSDKITVGALKVLQTKKIRIPEEMGLVGFSNSDLTELLNPSLTIIRQPAFEMGEVATDLLLQLIESKRPTKDFNRQVLETELIIRDSTRRKS
ncbi:LacI family DNA-binding transcriptional regulator [Aridibaculum aurantiacum]|uniref:LacI family DNA-binding transcriptional regulator n=1 Tax=Aridibaculum aurantiacum TaxID=2810307 RepID=UPI001A9719DF|nr:LacI family DNA-binding transcriptional regulator [Aridibaculum aurantiacum]